MTCSIRSFPVKAVRWARPVVMSQKAIPADRESAQTAQRKLLAFSSRQPSLVMVPGVTTRMMSRFTSPLARAGSSICSQMATL